MTARSKLRGQKKEIDSSVKTVRTKDGEKKEMVLPSFEGNGASFFCLRSFASFFCPRSFDRAVMVAQSKHFSESEYRVLCVLNADENVRNANLAWVAKRSLCTSSAFHLQTSQQCAPR